MSEFLLPSARRRKDPALFVSKLPEVPDLRPLPDIIIRGHVDDWSSYGKHLGHVALGLQAAGYSVGVIPITLGTGAANAPDDLKPLLWSPRETRHKWEILITPLGTPPQHVNTVWLTMHESDKLTVRQQLYVRQAKKIITVSEWCADVFEGSGERLGVDVDTVPMGIDTGVFHNRPKRPKSDVFRVGCAARFNFAGWRKNLPQSVAAFLEAFPETGQAKFCLKCYPDDVFAIDHVLKQFRKRPDDLEINGDHVSTTALADWYRTVDVLLHLSFAEGFGLMPLQAMACGTPCVATGATGDAEFISTKNSYLVRSQVVPVEKMTTNMQLTADASYYTGSWHKPVLSDVVTVLRKVKREWHTAPYKNRQKNGANLAKKYTWKTSNRRLLQALRRWKYIT